MESEQVERAKTYLLTMVLQFVSTLVALFLAFVTMLAAGLDAAWGGDPSKLLQVLPLFYLGLAILSATAGFKMLSGKAQWYLVASGLAAILGGVAILAVAKIYFAIWFAIWWFAAGGYTLGMTYRHRQVA